MDRLLFFHAGERLENDPDTSGHADFVLDTPASQPGRSPPGQFPSRRPHEQGCRGKTGSRPRRTRALDLLTEKRQPLTLKPLDLPWAQRGGGSGLVTLT